MNMPTVFLVGFMGAGKTTAGKKIAQRLTLSFIDLDQAICKAHSRPSLADLIEKEGMDNFRKMEAETLRSLPLAGSVIATGGGAPCFYRNMDWMLAKGVVAYLKLDEKALFSRLKQTDLSQRPLLKGFSDDELKNYITETLAQRESVYGQAHVILNPIQQTPDEMALVVQQYVLG